jgi:hypothetical protein
MRGIILGVLLVPLVAGCAISKDGVGFASRAPATQPGAPGILIVGTTGPLRTLDEQRRDEFYRGYLASASQQRPGEPHPLSPAEFQERSAGWASIQTAGIPLVGSLRYRVLVPASAAHDARFASAAGSFLFGATADLVAARSDRDGLVWIDRVLCSKADRNFESCAEKYQSGVFDEETGRELGRDRKPKANGEWVDVSSYVRLSKDPEHHSASELDVRAINRCDDCKGSLPGSVQSSVPAPPTR